MIYYFTNVLYFSQWRSNNIGAMQYANAEQNDAGQAWYDYPNLDICYTSNLLFISIVLLCHFTVLI